MKSAGIWGLSYLEEMTRNQAQTMINGFSEEQMIRFLLKRGFSVSEVIKEYRSMQKLIKEQSKGITGNDTSKHRHRHRHKAH